mgnify:CR=1 FL=1
MITKAEAIRRVTQDDVSYTNDQIKMMVSNRYGLEVETNQIIGIVGSWNERRQEGAAGRYLMAATKEYLSKCGGSKHRARRLINSLTEEA